MKIRKFVMGGLAAAAALTLAACSSTAPAEESAAGDKPVTIRVQAQNSIAAEPLYMGIEEGFFADEGLNVEVVDLPDIAAATAALQAGKLELAFVPTISALQMARQNVPITLIAASDGINPDAQDASREEQRDFTSVGVYTSPGSGITDLQGLAGAKIAVPELKGQPDGTITSVLHEAGVETDDIEWMNLGFVPALEALKSDQIDAAFLVSPFSLEADAAGMARVMNPSVEFFPRGSATTGWAASTSWATDNPEAVAAFQRGIAKSAGWASDNLDKAKQHVIDRAGLKLTPAEMPQSYWPSEIDPEQLAEVDQKLVDIGFFDAPIDVSEVLTASAN
ncbi:putative extracellular solute-binding protein [Leucobacter sp. 7(1)]|uniref:ABC transporter substrate-binding protein n=1 Tax=Leucobacter sp. 7(1) TaxID=1255613 RepID=UPI00097EC8BD|nr:ABC transporter substrate-binding protein [Leucobacter sp. 7(1)]SJN09043.1 putative extracellular solute-binding protein [Leucobacter sp. 7(1)]